MKKILVLSALFIIAIKLLSIEIPYSQKEIKTPENRFDNFICADPDTKAKIPLKTVVWLWHDDENLFVLWEANIDKGFEKGHFASRDSWVNADFLRIQIITDIKNYYAYMFFAFPLGNIYDGIRKTDLDTDDTWDSNYQYENTINDTVWKSLMKIPIKDMRFFGEPPYKWKIILTRYFEKKDESYFCPYVKYKMGKDYFRKAADITIKEKLKGNKNYKITPYFIKKYNLLDKTTSFDPDNIGLDFSYKPTSATKVKLSLNPDFSDVPPDNEMDNFNSKYAPYLFENRYFFIEDLDVFGTDDTSFYTRNIIQPQYAVKLTGNTEKFSYGILSVKDKKITENGYVENNDDMYNMIAIKPKWENFSLQTTIVNRISDNFHNEVFLIKPNWELYKNHTVSGEINFSHLDQEDTKNGFFYIASYQGRVKDFSFNLNAAYTDKNFDNKTGRVFENNENSISVFINQNTQLDKKFIQSFGNMLNLNTSHENDTKNLKFDLINFYSHVSFKPKFGMNIFAQKIRERYMDKLFNLWFGGFGFNIWRFKSLNTRFNYHISKSIVYSLNNSYLRRNLSIGLWGYLSSYFSYSISLQNSKYYDIPDDASFDDFYYISNADVTLNLSNKLSIKNGLRYQDFSNGHLGFYSNLKYEFRKNSNLYIGYKNSQDEMGNTYESTFKQAYMKISYTF